MFTALGFPAVAITSLTFVDKLVGYLVTASRDEYLFNSQDVSVTATQQGAAADPNTVRLTKGWYLVVPQDHEQYLATDGSLTITNAGCLVRREASA